MKEYDKEELTQTISTEELIHHFRNEEEVSGYCRKCENFGRSWGCPPFDFDVEDRLKQYNEVLLVATKITLKEQGLPLNAAQELILPERRRIDKRLLELEKEHSGLACSYVGKCYYCTSESWLSMVIPPRCSPPPRTNESKPTLRARWANDVYLTFLNASFKTQKRQVKKNLPFSYKNNPYFIVTSAFWRMSSEALPSNSSNSPPSKAQSPLSTSQ